MVTALRRRLENEKGKYQQVADSLMNIQTDLICLAQSQQDIERAIWILQHVVSSTQEALTFYISDPVTAALEAIFPEPYKFITEFVQRRGKTEVDFFLERDGLRVTADPDDAVGGGVTNIVSIAIRTSLFSLGQRMGRKTRPVLMLDEPFHFVHGKVNLSRVSGLLKAISAECGLQLIVVTGEEDSEEIVSQADRVFRVSKVRGESVVEIGD